jgi:hypothetical protein
MAKELSMIERNEKEKARIVQSGERGFFLRIFCPVFITPESNPRGLSDRRLTTQTPKRIFSTDSTLFQHHQSNGGWTAFR